MKSIDVLTLAVLLTALALSLLVLWHMWPREQKTYELLPSTPLSTNTTIAMSALQFYPNVRYPDKEITYKIESQCSEKKVQNIQQALALLSSRTLLRFVEDAAHPQLVYLCSDLPSQPKMKDHFVAGEGGPTDIVNTSAFYVILAGKVSLFRPEKCEEPTIALHETLHALGFDHSTHPKSIMYPITGCDQEFDDTIVNEINRLYGIESLADLAIEKAEANASGRYLHFQVLVANHGLRNAEQVQLIITANNEQIKTFDLKDVSLGIKQQITAQNLRIPTETQKITFLVKTVNNERELSYDNNNIILVLQQK